MRSHSVPHVGLDLMPSRNMNPVISPTSQPGLLTEMKERDEDTIVRYGDVIRLYCVSHYSKGKEGGYVGYYCKGKSKRGVRGHKAGPFVAIPPFDEKNKHQFMASCFQVADPTGGKQNGSPLRYGEEISLIDDQGMVWNNMQGPISYIGPKAPAARGEMRLKLFREFNEFEMDDGGMNGEEADANKSVELPPVRYGDIKVMLDVVNVNRKLLKNKYTNFITNFRKDTSSLVGGYLVCDGRGFPIDFTIHHAPPHVAKLAMFKPSAGIPNLSKAPMPSEVHYNLPWNASIAFSTDRQAMLMAPPTAQSSPGSPPRERRKSAAQMRDEHLSNAQPVLAITLTNGGRTTITRSQLQLNSTSTDGFWIDLGDSHDHSYDGGMSKNTERNTDPYGEDDEVGLRASSAKGSLHISCTCETDLVTEGHDESASGPVKKVLWSVAILALLAAAGGHYSLPSNRVSPFVSLPLDPHEWRDSAMLFLAGKASFRDANAPPSGTTAANSVGGSDEKAKSKKAGNKQTAQAENEDDTDSGVLEWDTPITRNFTLPAALPWYGGLEMTTSLTLREMVTVMLTGLATCLIATALMLTLGGSLGVGYKTYSRRRRVSHLSSQGDDEIVWDLTFHEWDPRPAHIVKAEKDANRTGPLDPSIDPETGILWMPHRFLMAEKGDEAAAKARWRDTVKWREDTRADEALQMPKPKFGIIKECYPHFFHGRDKAGNLVYYECPGGLNTSRLKGVIDKDIFVNHIQYLQEFIWTVLQPEQEDRITAVIDLGGVGASLLLNREIVGILKACVVMTGAHYPERSYKIVVLNVPSWFGNIFALVKPLLNDVQKAKINIFKEAQVAAGLRKIIDEDQIPTVYGGTDPNPIGQSPPEVELHEHAMKVLREKGEALYTDEQMVDSSGARYTADTYKYSPQIRLEKKKR